MFGLDFVALCNCWTLVREVHVARAGAETKPQS